MERMDETNIDPIVRFIHKHRYEWVRPLCRGMTVDVACGIGYGSKILCENQQVTKYVGVDYAPEALLYGEKHYATTGIDFLRGDATCLPFPDGVVDTVVSLETLEHLHQPEAAIREFSRILGPSGIIVGSVPTRAYEELSATLYGGNPYHHKVFDLGELRALLSEHFAKVWFFVSTVDVVSRFTAIPESPKTGIFTQCGNSDGDEAICGSYHFIAAKNEAKIETSLPDDCFMYGITSLRYDQIRYPNLYGMIDTRDRELTEKNLRIEILERKLSERENPLLIPVNIARRLINKVKNIVSPLI